MRNVRSGQPIVLFGCTKTSPISVCTDPRSYPLLLVQVEPLGGIPALLMCFKVEFHKFYHGRKLRYPQIELNPFFLGHSLSFQLIALQGLFPQIPKQPQSIALFGMGQFMAIRG